MTYPDVQVLLLSQLLSQAGRATLSYRAMVWTAAIGGSQLQMSRITSSGALAALLFGLQGGQVADSMTKRVALANGSGVVAMPTLGTIATCVGSKIVVLIAPVVVTLAIVGLMRFSYRYTDEPEPGRRDVLAPCWDESGAT